MKVKFLKYDINAKMPIKAHPSDYGYDVYAVSEKQIAENVWQYGLGFGLQIERCDEKFDGQVIIDTQHSPLTLSIDFRPRSSVWKTGMVLSNSCGTIDENYTGEIKVVFYHVMPNMPRYKVGDKIAQCKLGMAFPMEFVEVDSLEDTDRGANGFGSSDK